MVRRPATSPGHPVVVVAGPGFGKTTWLTRHCPPGGVVGPAYELLERGVAQRGWVGVDDLHELTATDQQRLLELLGSADELTLTSRLPLQEAVAARLSGVPRVREAADLALSPYGVSQILGERGVADASLALQVWDLTRGWPALVHLAADELARDRHRPLGTALADPDSATASWVLRQVVDQLTALEYAVLARLAAVVPLAPVTPSACAAVAARLTSDDAAQLSDRLRALGLLLPVRVLDSTRLHLVPVIAQVVARAARAEGFDPAVDPHGDRLTTARALAAVHEADQSWLAAAACHAAAGDHGRAREVLQTHGRAILGAGGAHDVVAVLAQGADGDPAASSPALRLVHADAVRMTGDVPGARQALAGVVADATALGWTPAAACRLAALAYLRGEFAEAAADLDRWEGPGPDLDAAADRWGPDLVDWLAATVHVQAMLGRADQASDTAVRCRQVATRLADERCLAVSHLALARTLVGARQDEHLAEALRLAGAAGDVQTAGRVLAAQTFRLLAAARYAEAVTPAREAVRLARAASPPGLQAAALHNLGEALARVGELAEARWQLECAVAVCRRLGPARAALPLVGLADVHRQLGHVERSRLAYAEAIELSQGSGDVQVLVPAWCGLALLGADDPSQTHEAAVGQAIRAASPALLAAALTTSGHLALGRGDRHTAASVAARAVAAAREHRAADLLAEALELAALAAAHPDQAREAFLEALSIWVAGGAAPAVARVQLLLGRLTGADATARSEARQAARRLTSLGVTRVHGRPVWLAGAGPSVSIRVLGQFSVQVDGVDVPLPAWRSRQARSLVKILVAHRGRVVTRERLCDLLWPHEDPARTGHRLSVLLTAVRRVLDPGRMWPAERYLVVDARGIRLELGSVVIDSEVLLADAAHAEQLLGTGDPQDAQAAREMLEHVDALYRGPAFDDEPDDDWADGLREQVRATWIRAVRRLVTLMSRDGRRVEALVLLTRLLEADPFDEQVHRRVVTTLLSLGRHGEARRAFDRWRRAMRDIDAPAPDPALLTLSPPPSPSPSRADRTLTAS